MCFRRQPLYSEIEPKARHCYMASCPSRSPRGQINALQKSHFRCKLNPDVFRGQRMTEMGYSPRVSSSLGAAAMLAAWLLTGTRRSNEARFWESFEACGAELGVLPGHNSFLISLSAPRRRFKRAAELLAEVLREPRFGLAEFERERVHPSRRSRQDPVGDAALSPLQVGQEHHQMKKSSVFYRKKHFGV